MSQQGWAYLAIGITLAVLIIGSIIYGRYMKAKKFSWGRFAARVAIFSAIATILYVVPVFQIKLPFLPTFMEIHFDEIPAFIAGYAYGPIVSVAVLLVKTAIKLPFSSTMCVGELCDLVLSCAFVLPATIIYSKVRNMKGVWIGFAASFLSQILVASLMNVYVLLPFYEQVMGFSEEDILGMCQAANASIQNLQLDYVLWAVLPLNAIKNAAVLLVTFIVYRSVRKPLHWEKERPSGAE